MADDKIPQVKYKRNDITAEFVRSVLDYNPETGIFIWKCRSDLPPRANGWNTRYAGKVAGRKKISCSYFELAINGNFYSIHRLAWLYMTGEWPQNEIDHKDTNAMNNRWDNLREATRIQNSQNTKIQKRNKIGFKGVKFRKDLINFPFSAKIKVNKKEIHLGYFSTPEEAHNAYCKAAIRYHKEFARLK